MGCEIRKVAGGGVMIACGSFGKRGHKCGWCKKPGIKQCDAAVPGDSKTCDRYICEDHAQNVGVVNLGKKRDTVDYCPYHAVKKPLTFDVSGFPE